MTYKKLRPGKDGSSITKRDENGNLVNIELTSDHFAIVDADNMLHWFLQKTYNEDCNKIAALSNVDYIKTGKLNLPTLPPLCITNDDLELFEEMYGLV